MTLYFPDISNFQAGMTLEKGTVAVIAKASEGTTFTDGAYAGFKAQAARLGALFSAYHFLWSADDEEVRHCHSVVGSTPLMIDAENASVHTTVAMIVAFATKYRKLGGRVWGVYLPRWYWENDLGSPSLKPLAAAGLVLVSSNYTTYRDSGPGWEPYGGMTPVQWQYTDALPYGGGRVDFNAFRGTVADLRKLWAGGAGAPTTKQVKMYTSVNAHNVPLVKGEPKKVQFTTAGAAGAWVKPYGDHGELGGYNVGVAHAAHQGSIAVTSNTAGARIRARFIEIAAGGALHKHWPSSVIADEYGVHSINHWNDKGSRLYVELTALDKDTTVDVSCITIVLN